MSTTVSTVSQPIVQQPSSQPKHFPESFAKQVQLLSPKQAKSALEKIQAAQGNLTQAFGGLHATLQEFSPESPSHARITANLERLYDQNQRLTAMENAIVQHHGPQLDSFSFQTQG